MWSMFIVIGVMNAHLEARRLATDAASLVQRGKHAERIVMTDGSEKSQHGQQTKKRQYFETESISCPKLSLTAKEIEQHFKSQFLEDHTLLQWFNGLCHGTYLEIGGLDGVKFSNSYFFNKAPGMNWKGVLVELGPKNFAELQRNRPNEIATVHAAVCDEARTVHFVEIENEPEVSGVWEFASKSFRDDHRWWKDLKLEDMTPISCSPLKDILSSHVGETYYFDFFSLDIEGGELAALQSLDFEKVGFGIILVECDGHNELKNLALRALLEDNGYRHLMDRDRSCWFYNHDFASIYNLAYSNTTRL